MTDESAFAEALAVPDPAARAAFLDRACPDPAQRSRVAARLAAAADTSPPDRPPPSEPARTGAYDPATSHRGPTAAVGDLVGPYRLLERIGEGGMGEVWAADQREPIKRRVALKLIKPGTDSRSVLGRFESERQALALMDHPNIARVLDAGTAADGRPYFVMELVKGTPITEFCDARKLTPRQRLELFVPVCQAIQHAHMKGIIHRDIKPSNVLVARYDDRPVPKVIDFGIAKATGAAFADDAPGTGIGAVVGTPQYMSPEQASLNNPDIDTRSDVYSLGVLLYELLAGSPPFSKKELEKRGLLEILRVVREEEPPRPSDKLSTADALPTLSANRGTEPRKLTGLLRNELDWVVMKALEKDRGRRYETANGFAADVLRYLAGEPVQAHPPTAGYRLRKFVRKNRAQVTAAGAVAVALVGGVVGTTLGLLEARRGRVAAEGARGDEARARAAAERERDAKEKARAAAEEQRRTATAERDAKERAAVRADGLRLAAEATAARRADPALGVLLAAEGVKRHPQHLTFAALYAAAGECREVRTVTAGGGVRFARFSPDARRVLVAHGTGGGASVHDAETGTVISRWPGYGMPVGAVDWSPDGRGVAAAVEGCVRAEYTDGAPPAAAVFTDRTVYVWDADTGKERLHLRGHGQRVVGVRFSPDGSRLLTAGWDGVARLWETDTGREIHALDAHAASLLPAAFSRDGKRVLTVSAGSISQSATDRTLAAFARSGQLAIDPGPSGRPARFGPPSSETANVTSSEPKLARVWDAATGKVTAGLTQGGGGTFGPYWVPTAGEFSPDGARVAVAFKQAVAAVWDAAADGKEQVTLTGHTGSVNAVAFSPSGLLLATAGADGTARLWDAATGRETARLRGHAAGVLSVRFSDDGRRLLTASEDGTARVWDTAAGEELAALRGHAGTVREAHFGPDGTRVLTAGDTTARIWTAAPPPELARVVRAHTAPLTALAFSPDGTRLLTASEDETAKLFDPVTGNGVAAFGPGFVLGPVRAAAFAPDGRTVVTASKVTSGGVKGKAVNGSSVHVWEAEGGANRRQIRDHRTAAEFVAFAPGGDKLVSVDDGSTESKGWPLSGSKSDSAGAGKVRVWDASTEKLLFAGPDPVAPKSRPEFSGDGRLLLTRPKNGPAALLDGANGHRLRTFPPGGDAAQAVAALSPDGKRVLTARGVEPGRLWDADGGGPVAELTGPAGGVSAARFSPDGRRLATVHGRSVAVWEAESGEPVATLAGHGAEVIALEFTPDGRGLLTGSGDRTAALWDAETGTVRAVFMGHPGPVKFVAYSPTGRHVATGSTDGVVRVWPPDPTAEALRRAPRQLTPAERQRYDVPAPAGR